MHKPANDPIFTFIEKKRGEGKSGKLAMVAGLNKFLRSDTSYPIGQCCVDIVNMDEEVLEPPAFWSVGCLTHKSEPFRLRFVLFATVCSADFPLFPSSPARFFRILGQKWVKRSPANTVDLQSRIDLRLSEEVRAENCSDFSHIFQSCGRIGHKFYGTI